MVTGLLNGCRLCSRFVYLQLFQNLGWEQVAALTEDGQKYTEYISQMQDLFQANDITFVVNRKFPRDREKSSMFKVRHALPLPVSTLTVLLWLSRLILGLNLETGHDHILTLLYCSSFTIFLLYLIQLQEICAAVDTVSVSLLYHIKESDISCMCGTCIVCKFIQWFSFFNDSPLRILV